MRTRDEELSGTNLGERPKDDPRDGFGLAEIGGGGSTHLAETSCQVKHPNLFQIAPFGLVFARCGRVQAPGVHS
jgi:hypothetical protein